MYDTATLATYLTNLLFIIYLVAANDLTLLKSRQYELPPAEVECTLLCSDYWHNCAHVLP